MSLLLLFPSAGSVSITAPSGLITISAPVPTVAAGGVSITAPTGLITVSAPAPSLTIAIAPPSGEITVSAPTPSIGAALLIDIPTGRLTISGSADITPEPEAPGPLIGMPVLIREAGKLGRVCHEITSRDGHVFWPTFGDWEANEEAPGGMTSASALLSERAYRAHPEVFRYGSTWRSFLETDGTCLWAGRVLEPEVSGAVRISGRGPASRADREVDELLYQTYDLSRWTSLQMQHQGWTVKIGRGLSDNDPDTPVTVSGIMFDKDDPERRGGSGVQFSSPDAELTRLAFSLLAGGDASSNCEIRVLASTDSETVFIGGHITAGPPTYDIWERTFAQEDPLPGIILSGASSTLDLTATNPEKINLDLTVDVNGDPIPGAVKTIAIIVTDRIIRGLLPDYPAPGRVTAASGSSVVFTKVRVNGIAPDDKFTASELALDIAGRIGLPHYDIDTNAHNVLPYELQGGTFGEALDYAALISGWRWLILHTGWRAYLDFGPYRKRQWVLTDPHARFEPVPQERFNMVQVPYKDPDTKTPRLVTLRADPDPLPDVRSRYPRIEDLGPVHGSDAAEELGYRLLEVLAKRRWSGESQLSEVIDEDGNRRSAHHLRAGDRLQSRVDDDPHAKMRIGSLTRTAESVTVQFDGELRALDRILARRQRRLAKTNAGGST